MELEPISDFSQRSGASTPLGAVTTGEKSVLFPGLSNLWIYGMISGPGMEPYRLQVELALPYTTPSQSEIGRSVGLGISTPCGEISILVISIRVCFRVARVVHVRVD